MVRHLWNPFSFILGILIGSFAVSFLIASIILSSEATTASALSSFLNKWQTLMAGMLGIVAGGSAIVAALLSAKNSEILAKKEKWEKEKALAAIIREDSLQTLKVVEELSDWAESVSSEGAKRIPYRDFVMGESLVNVWSAFPYVPASIAKELFDFSHSMFDCQIQTRTIAQVSEVSPMDREFNRFRSAVARSLTSGKALLEAMDTLPAALLEKERE